MRNEKELREHGFVKYEELSEKAQKIAHDRFAYDFVNDKWSDKTEEEIMTNLSRHWFDKDGGTFMGTHWGGSKVRLKKEFWQEVEDKIKGEVTSHRHFKDIILTDEEREAFCEGHNMEAYDDYVWEFMSDYGDPDGNILSIKKKWK